MCVCVSFIHRCLTSVLVIQSRSIKNDQLHHGVSEQNIIQSRMMYWQKKYMKYWKHSRKGECLGAESQIPQKFTFILSILLDKFYFSWLFSKVLKNFSRHLFSFISNKFYPYCELMVSYIIHTETKQKQKQNNISLKSILFSWKKKYIYIINRAIQTLSYSSHLLYSDYIAS